jgi:hypothetical protein
MDTVPTWFAVTIRDRWNNTTDTLKALLIPRFEEETDKSLFRLFPLPGDAGSGHGWVHERLWDGLLIESGWVSNTVSPLPIHISIDMGATYFLSRMRYWNRVLADYYFDREAVLKMEVWGSTNPNLDGSFDDSWTLLMTTPKVEKPSGLPFGELTNDDIEAGQAGFEFTFPPGSPSVRYLRFRILETGNNGAEVTFEEVSLWGERKK